MTKQSRKIVWKKAIIQNKKKVVGLTTLGLTLGALSLITLNSQASYKTSNKRSQTNTLNSNLLVQKTLGIRKGKFIAWAGRFFFGLLGWGASEATSAYRSNQQEKILNRMRDDIEEMKEGQRRITKLLEGKNEEASEPEIDTEEWCDAWKPADYLEEYPGHFCMDLFSKRAREREQREGFSS